MNISKYFYKSSSTEEIKDNIYFDIMIEILRKKRNKFFTIYGILNMYSLSSKKKVEDIMNDKNDIDVAIDLIKKNDNIIYYYYCKNNKLYYVFEYTISPDVRAQRNNVEINIIESVDGCFAKNIDTDTLKNILIEPKKYLNFNPKYTNIDGNNILKHLIVLNEEETLKNIIDKYNVSITDNENGCGIKYDDLLQLALESKNVNIVNFINKFYYDKKCNQIKTISSVQENDINERHKNIEIIKIVGSIVNVISFPILLYISFFKFNSC